MTGAGAPASDGIAAGAAASTGPVGADAAARATAEALTALGARVPDIAVVFVGAAHAGQAEAVGAVVRARSGAHHLVGATTAGGVLAGDHEHEDPRAVAVWLACLPGADVTPLRYPPPRDPGAEDDEAVDDEADGWRPPPEEASGAIVLADARSFPLDGWCAWLAAARPGLLVSGGLATGPDPRAGARLLLDDAVHDGGAVGFALGGAVAVRTLVSQGCRPVGDAYVVTRAEGNVVLELAGRAPVERLRDLYAEAPPSDRALMRDGLHIGIVVDEYLDDPGPGDYLVRTVLGAQRDGGGLAVGDVVRVGQTVRFHVRDAASADTDLRLLLALYAEGPRPDAALLFTCHGRGARLFGGPDHDARAVRAALADVALAGSFCAGEVGPVGGRSVLHGFTASLVGFVPSAPSATSP